MNRPQFIEHLEFEGHIFFSQLIVYDKIVIEKLEEKKIPIVWSASEYQDDKLLIYDRVYKTQHPFYIYLSRDRLNKNYGEINIFYEATQIQELKFFIKPFIKSIKI
jgi:hypothetical protein